MEQPRSPAGAHQCGEGTGVRGGVVDPVDQEVREIGLAPARDHVVVQDAETLREREAVLQRDQLRPLLLVRGVHRQGQVDLGVLRDQATHPGRETHG